jgi:hypothetical protein
VADGIEKNANTSNENFVIERKFREDVYQWLTNGKPKIFHSPVEGNLIVQLMNVSLTPVERLGRMISTFNCTAYEIAEYSMDNIVKFDLLFGGQE